MKTKKALTPHSEAWGMTASDYKAHIAMHGSSSNPKSPMRKYVDQRKNAKNRGLEWEFTFSDWWKVWCESGKWDLRARGTGYVMARHGDGDTPYSKETVYICTATQNVKDSFVNTPSNMRSLCRESTRKGNGAGWTLRQSYTKNPYLVQFAGKRLGCYPTAEIARAVYLAAFEASKATQGSA